MCYMGNTILTYMGYFSAICRRFCEIHPDVLTLLFKLLLISIRKPRRTMEGNPLIIQYGGLRGSLIIHITVATEYHALCVPSSRIISSEDTNLSRDRVAYIICDALVYGCKGNMGYAAGTLWRKCTVCVVYLNPKNAPNGRVG